MSRQPRTAPERPPHRNICPARGLPTGDEPAQEPHGKHTVTMETATPARESSSGAPPDRDRAPRRPPPPRVSTRGAASHFVGSSILILSSFAVSTLAMNFGKKIQESRQKSRST